MLLSKIVKKLLLCVACGIPYFIDGVLLADNNKNCNRRLSRKSFILSALSSALTRMYNLTPANMMTQRLVYWRNRMRVIKSLLAGALALGLTTSVAVADGHGWKPKKPVEFIIMAGAGGGADQIARLLQGIIEKRVFRHVHSFRLTSRVVRVQKLSVI